MNIDINLCKFISPFSMIIAGPSGSGKTQLLKSILKHHRTLINPEKLMLNVIWIYGVWQDNYNKMIPFVEIVYTDCIPTEDELRLKKPDLIVIDDLMNEICDDKSVSNFFTKTSHHLDINVILIIQNLYKQGKHMRDLSLNSHYLILMKNPRDVSQIDILGRQLKISKALEQAYKDAVKYLYGYLVIDFKQTTPAEFMLKTRINPEETKNNLFSPIFYIIK